MKQQKFETFEPKGTVPPPTSMQEIRERIATLNPKQRYIANVMLSGNTPFLQGFPGTAKSAWFQRIADILGMKLIVLWLSRCDETDFSLPMAHDAEGLKVHTMTVPTWALEANKQPTILLMEELNRCSQGVMNACLGVIQERTLGFGFYFKNTTWIGSCGNFGEADGTVVNEFDTALCTRVVPIKHELTAKDWLSDFASRVDSAGVPFIHPIIRQYIEAKPGMIYRLNKNSRDDSGMVRPYPNPRTYHNLSKYLMAVCGPEAGFAEVAEEVNEHAIDFLGKESADLIHWVADNSNLTIKDVLTRYSQVKDQIKAARIPEFFKDLGGIKLADLKEKEIENMTLFFKDIESKKMNDQIMAYFQESVTKLNNDTVAAMVAKGGAFKNFLKEFKNYILSANKKVHGK